MEDLNPEFEKAEKMPEFNGWNVYFILIYFLNMVNLERLGTAQGAALISPFLMVFQLGLVALLVYTSSLKWYLITLGIAEIPFKIVQIIEGNLILGNFTFLFTLFIILAVLFKALYKRVKGSDKLKEISANFLFSILISLCFLVIPISGALYLIFDILWICVITLPFPAILLLVELVFSRMIRKERLVYNPALTHHMIEESDHTIAGTLGNVTIFFCTRCAGMIMGVLFSIYLVATFTIEFTPLVALIMDIFIPMPIFIDWGTQRLGFRISTTTSRIITGALTGFGFYLITFSTLEFPIGSSIILGTYFVIFFLIYFISNRRMYAEDDDEFY